MEVVSKLANPTHGQWVDVSDPFNYGNRFLTESHPRQWVVVSDPFYYGNRFLSESHPRQWVVVQILSTTEQVSLGIPPTAVGGGLDPF